MYNCRYEDGGNTQEVTSGNTHFFRPVTKKKGSGLGLAIVNKIILDHNGSINLSNTKDGAKIDLSFNIIKNGY